MGVSEEVVRLGWVGVGVNFKYNLRFSKFGKRNQENSPQINFVLPLKALGIMLVGIQQHSCKHPCPYCFWISGTVGMTVVLRTFTSIIEWNQKWKVSGGNRDRLKDFMNCEFLPILNFPLREMIINVFPIAQLHVMLGVTNKIVFEFRLIYPAAVRSDKKSKTHAFLCECVDLLVCDVC